MENLIEVQLTLHPSKLYTEPPRKAFPIIQDSVSVQLGRKNNPYQPTLRYDLTPSVLNTQARRRHKYYDEDPFGRPGEAILNFLLLPRKGDFYWTGRGEQHKPDSSIREVTIASKENKSEFKPN